MATFIPEWARIPTSWLPVKRVLDALDDAYVVRRPLRPDVCAADFFVQHRTQGWLAVAVESAPFAVLDAGRLFDSPERHTFEQRLAALPRVGSAASPSTTPPPSLVVLPACLEDEARRLGARDAPVERPQLVSKSQWLEQGTALVQQLMKPVPPSTEEWLLGTHFPEAELPLEPPTRIEFHRDNRARLGRAFFDVDQEWATKLDLDLFGDSQIVASEIAVRLVNGVAGSGKTLIALRRAFLLTERFPTASVLLLIHNTPIVADLLARLCRAGTRRPPNLKVLTFSAWASRQWREVFGVRPQMPKTPEEIFDVIRHLRTRWPELTQPDQQLFDELDFINDTLIHDEDEYQDASRTGRGFALRPRDRSAVWSLHRVVTEHLRRGRLRMWSALPADMCLAGDAAGTRLRKYHHILVDEAQFFAPSGFELIKRSLRRGGQVFLCADPNQGFLKTRLSWKRAGLDVVGRTKKLRRPYRTTRALLEAANGALASLGRSDDEDFLVPDFGAMRDGLPPRLVYAASPQDATDRLVNELIAMTHEHHVHVGAALVIYGQRLHGKWALHERLTRTFGATNVWWFNKHTQKKKPPAGYGRDYLRMAYVDSATGLEAPFVFLIGAENLFGEGDGGGANAETRASEREERVRKRYMAMTRASQRLVLIASRRLPAALERLFEVERVPV